MKQRHIRFDLEKVFQLRKQQSVFMSLGVWERTTIDSLRLAFLGIGISERDGGLYKVKRCDNSQSWFILCDTGRLRKISDSLVDTLEITKEEYLVLILKELKEDLLEQDSG